MRILAAVLALAACAALGACRRHVVVHDHDEVVVIERGHVHTDHCGHYHRAGRWYHHAGHVHRGGCGHALRGGLWVVVD